MEIDKAKEKISELTKAIEQNPQDASAYHKRGDVYYKMEEYNKTILDYRKAFDITPNNPEICFYLGASYFLVKDYKKSLEFNNKALAIKPKVEYYWAKGDTLAAIQNYDKALEYYDKALEIDPDNPTAYECKGELCRKLGDDKQAIKNYEKAIEVDPDYAPAYQGIGILYNELGNDEKAKDYLLASIYLEHDYIKDLDGWIKKLLEKIDPDIENNIYREVAEAPQDPKLWDKWWIINRNDHAYATFFGKVKPHEINRWIEMGFRSILFPGNGNSQNPKWCYYAGFQVTALDISLVAIYYAKSFLFDKKKHLKREYTEHKNGISRDKVDYYPQRDNGTIEYITGDFIAPSVAAKKYDIVHCQNTLQYYQGELLEQACKALVERLNSPGLLYIGVANSGRAVEEIRKTLEKEDIEIVDNYYGLSLPIQKKYAYITLSTG